MGKSPRQDSLVLEVMTDVDAMRRATCMKESTIAEFPTTEHLQAFERYLSLVRQLIKREVDDASFKFGWTSPLAGRPTQFGKVVGLPQEACMAANAMAAAMRCGAYMLSEAAAAGPSGEGVSGAPLPAAAIAAAAAAHAAVGPGSGPLAEAATLLRKAAGVHAWLAEDALLRVMNNLAADRPVELIAPMATCLSRVCLAEAQAVTAHRAGQRGTSPGTTAALHLGAAHMFEEAARGLRERAADLGSVSDKLRRFLAISASLQRARAQRWWGLELLGQGEAGVGEGCCLEAAAAVTQCMVVAEGEEAWKRVLAMELEEVEGFRKRIEKDRAGVYYQSVVQRPDKSLPPSAKVLVTAVPYIPLAGVGSSSMDRALETE
ncbi:hypothetical protein FOA52_011801 [Chlamydomonas sp. UWO 241]|nr:hypothetical protein FOA52_011801 [Chlamydomonas sp. UWO 241]